MSSTIARPSAAAQSAANGYRASLPAHELDALCTRVRQFIDEECIPREDFSKAHDIEWLEPLPVSCVPVRRHSA